jgi:hypothetical protein
MRITLSDGQVVNNDVVLRTPPQEVRSVVKSISLIKTPSIEIDRFLSILATKTRQAAGIEFLLRFFK